MIRTPPRVSFFVCCLINQKFEKVASYIDFAPHSNGAWLPLEGELADARYERLTEEVCGEFWVCR